MLKKWERYPRNFGVGAGIIALPLLWWLQNRLLHLAFAVSSPFSMNSIPQYFLVGAIPCAILGGGISQALCAQRKEDWVGEKRQLLLHGAIVFTLLLCLFSFWSWLVAQYISGSKSVFSSGLQIPLWLFILLKLMLLNLPFQIASLMLFIGLLMRPRR